MARPKVRPELEDLTESTAAAAYLRRNYHAPAVQHMRSALDTAADLRSVMRIADALEPELRGVRMRRRARPEPGELEVRRPSDGAVRDAVDKVIAPLLRIRDEVLAYLSDPACQPTLRVPPQLRRSGLRLEALLVTEAARAAGVRAPDEYDLLALENAGPVPHRSGSERTARSRWDQWRYALARVHEVRLLLAHAERRRSRTTSSES